MTVTFKNAPLVELVAEVHWSPASAAGLGGANQLPGAPPRFSLGEGNRLEEFYMRFGGEVFSKGFQRSERVVPPGFPSIQNQVAVRFRKESGSEMLQVGPGVFAANAVPPYRSWKDFAPCVELGLDCLLRSRHDDEKNLPFNSILMRYIDGFKKAHLVGMSHAQFMRDVLGFEIGAPVGVNKWLDGAAPSSVSLQLAGPMTNGMQLALTVADGVIQGESAVVMDMTISTARAVAPNVAEAMKELAAARDVAHDIFLNVTAKIRDVMGPE
jgi:uncharacterized protein (TIGR04255 family)